MQQLVPWQMFQSCQHHFSEHFPFFPLSVCVCVKTTVNEPGRRFWREIANRVNELIYVFAAAVEMTARDKCTESVTLPGVSLKPDQGCTE